MFSELVKGDKAKIGIQKLLTKTSFSRLSILETGTNLDSHPAGGM